MGTVRIARAVHATSAGAIVRRSVEEPARRAV